MVQLACSLKRNINSDRTHSFDPLGRNRTSYKHDSDMQYYHPLCHYQLFGRTLLSDITPDFTQTVLLLFRIFIDFEVELCASKCICIFIG